MRLPWKARKPGDSHVRVTNKVNLGDVDDRSRSYASTIERPDQYTPLDHSRATFGVDRETAMLMVVENVRRALDAGSVDEFTSDFMDARINTARVGWDVAVDFEANARMRTTLQLMAVELENITRVQATIQDERQAVAELQASVSGWRAVLLGSSRDAPRAAAEVGSVSASAPELPTIPRHSTITELLMLLAARDHEAQLAAKTAPQAEPEAEAEAEATQPSPVTYITFDEEQAR